MASIADLAQFAKTTTADYRQRTDQLLEEYRFERATELESDVYDRWARLRFVDGSELTVRDDKLIPCNANEIPWGAPNALQVAEAISATLHPAR